MEHLAFNEMDAWPALLPVLLLGAVAFGLKAEEDASIIYSVICGLVTAIAVGIECYYGVTAVLMYMGLSRPMAEVVSPLCSLCFGAMFGSATYCLETFFSFLRRRRR